MAKIITDETLPGMVAKAVELGRNWHVFAADWRNSHLSRQGWIDACVRLAGVADEAELRVLAERIRIEAPRLDNLIARVAEGWCRVSFTGRLPVSRPAPHGLFHEPEMEVAAYVARKNLGLSGSVCSAISGLQIADRGLCDQGRAPDPEQPGRYVEESFAQPLAELQELVSRYRPTWAELEQVQLMGLDPMPGRDLIERARQLGARRAVEHADKLAA